MKEPQILTSRTSPGIFKMIFAIITGAVKLRKHPVILYHSQASEKMFYIENDRETIIITMEHKLKPITQAV